MRQILFLLMFLTTTALGAWAQTAKLTGTVTDASGKGLSAATISLLKAADNVLVKLAVTDKEGRYEFINLKEGKYKVAVTSVGFTKGNSTAFDIATGAVELPVIILQQAAKDLSGVTVTAKKPFVETRIDKTIVNVDASPTSAGATALEVLEKSPGISVNNDGVVSLRGKSGVIMMVDGKLTYLSATDLANLLKNMPASQLDQIEIITNPSAKYDASGNAGVINIKTKKGRAEGWNGNFSIGATTSIYRFEGTTYFLPKSQNSLNFNYKKGKMNLFGNYNPNFFKGRNTMTFNRQFIENGLPSGSSDQVTKFQFVNSNHTLKLGLDYQLNKKNSFGVVVSGFAVEGRPIPVTKQTLRDAAGTITSIMVSQTKNIISNRNLTGNLNWKHNFDTTGKELTTDFDVVRYNNSSSLSLNTDFYNGAGLKSGDGLLLRGELPSDIIIYSLKSDLTIPYKGGRLEAGIKNSYVTNDNEVDYRRQLSDKTWARDNRSNHFIYDEMINAAYASANKQLGRWSVQGGLRLENTVAKGHQVTNDSTFRRNFTNLFPSAFISYATTKKNTVTLSYSRRITRPSYQDLNPFTFFLDSLTYRVGNPYLLPQFTHNVELGYAFKSKYVVSVNYNNTNDVISQILRQDNQKKITYLTSENVANFRNIGLSVTAPFTVAKWWNTNFFTNIFNNRYRGTYNNEPINIAYTSFSANITNSFQIKQGLSAELSGFYRHKGVDQLTITEPVYQISLGASKTIMQGKGTLRLNVRDPFAWQRFNGLSQYGDVNMRVQNRPDVRQVSLVFTKRFGKTTQNNAPRRRASSSQDEQNRVGGQ